MSLLSNIFSLLTSKMLNNLEENRKNPVQFQQKLFSTLTDSLCLTEFGKEHGIKRGISLNEFQNSIPLRDYDNFEPFIERVRRGEEKVLWDKPTIWFAKSSGTSTARSKFIPVSSESLHSCHFSGMKKMIATYVNNNPDSRIFDGDTLTLGGSVTVDELGTGKSHYGDLSAILLRNSPVWVEMRRVPGQKTALLSDFEKKVEEICKNAHKYNVTNFSGVPSWNLVLMRKILEYTGKKTLPEIWPNLELFMHGGINFDPYRSEFKKIIPSEQMRYMENYNASEGYFAFQDNPQDKSMLLLTDNGVFYEFIPMSRLNEALSGRYTNFDTTETVNTTENYAVVITTNGGLWRYLLGDCVHFTSLFPHKIIISGRTQLFINTFGEELMINNAERAMTAVCEKHSASVANYTVAPLFMEGNLKGAHQWLIEFSTKPNDITAFTSDLDKELRSLNSDYDAKRNNNVTMSMPEVVVLNEGLFYEWMRQKGKLGGQNKVPRLSGERTYADQLLEIQNSSFGKEL
jgi:hypothetical protein